LTHLLLKACFALVLPAALSFKIGTELYPDVKSIVNPHRFTAT
jgi:hypothetical protein